MKIYRIISKQKRGINEKVLPKLIDKKILLNILLENVYYCIFIKK